jgi:RNA polymerase sigma factor (TIGR02999 family)
MATQEITLMLKAWGEGDRAALEQLTSIVYDELHRLAHRYLRREQQGHALQTSELVNEAWLRLIDAEQVSWQNRAHFFGVSARLMRQILVDFARSRQSLKRGAEVCQVTLGEAADIVLERETDLVALDDALNALAALDPRQSQVVELRFFGGLSLEETAEVLKVSPGTVRRDWRMARAWLHRTLSHDSCP